MKKPVNNLGYYTKEAKTLFRIDFLSNISSIISIGLIFFVLALVISGWKITNHTIGIVESEAEINVYFDDMLDGQDIAYLEEDIKQISGIEKVIYIDEDESYNRMAEILGRESHVLSLFDENPFTPFIEVQIHMDEIEHILNELENIDSIEYIRDNKEIIDRLKGIVILLKILGVLALLAVGVSTLIIVSHIIRQGIYTNKEQIKTLKLLGAPDTFINLPFLLEGLFLTISGGIIASLLLIFAVKYSYGKMGTILPFIPLPSSKSLIGNIVTIIISISGILGIIGSIFGLRPTK